MAAAAASTSKDTSSSAKNGVKQTDSTNKAAPDANAAGAGNATTTPGTANANGDLSDPKTSYENVKKELVQAIQRKKQLDKQLVWLLQ